MCMHAYVRMHVCGCMCVGACVGVLDGEGNRVFASTGVEL